METPRRRWHTKRGRRLCVDHIWRLIGRFSFAAAIAAIGINGRASEGSSSFRQSGVILGAAPSPMHLADFGSAAASVDVQSGWIRGQVHVVFKGFDLPLKQIPIYLISASSNFVSAYLELRGRVVPLLDVRDAAAASSREWIRASQAILDIERQRVKLFRQYTFRTVYADNQGLFVFHDIPPGVYLVFVEGAIKDQMMIWAAPISLKDGDDVRLDFGPQNVGDTRSVYAWPGTHAKRK